MLEGSQVLAQGGRHVLGLDEAEVLSTRVAQDVAEQIDAALALAGEVEVVDGVIHLSLGTRRRLEADHRQRRRSGTQRAQPLADHGIPARETALTELLQEPHGGQIGISTQQFVYERKKRIETAGPPLNG